MLLSLLIENFGYNISLETGQARIMAEQTKEKISLSMKGRSPIAAHEASRKSREAGIPHHSTGLKMSKEAKLKKSETIKNWSEERRNDYIEQQRQAVLNRPGKCVFKQDKITLMMDLDGNIIKEYPSVKSIVEDYPAFLPSSIARVCRGDGRKKSPNEYNGYLFKYKL